MEAAKRINQTKIDVLGSLPPEIVQNISLYLTPEDLENALTGNKLWNKLLNPNYFWYKKCQDRGYNELKHTSMSAIYEKYLARFPLYWQLFFNYNQLQYNWMNDIFKTTSVPDGNSLQTLYYFDDEVLIAMNRYQKILIIDSCTGQIKNTIASGKYIFRFAKYQNLLVIVMRGNTLDSLENKICLEVLTIEGKSLYVTDELNDILTTGDFENALRLKVYKTLIAINRREGQLRIIDFEKKTICYKSANVCYVCFGDEIIAVGKTNGMIEILDMKCIRLQRFNYGMRLNINKIMISQHYMVAIAQNPHSYDGDLNARVWNLKENVSLYTIKGISIFFENYTCSIYQDQFIYITKARNRRKRKLVVLDLSTGNHILDISISSYEIGTSLSNGHYMFVTTTATVGTSGTAYIHCSQSGKEISSISDILWLDSTTYTIRLTETKLAYITNKGDLLIRNYEKFIH